MTLRALPAIEAVQALSSIEWRPDDESVGRWSAEIRAASESDRTISILDAIGENFFGEGVSSKRIAAALRTMGEGEVTVSINSPGGDFFEGVAIYNMLREHKGRVVVNVLSLAASAASVIAMAADELRVASSGFLMIHNAEGLVFGNRHEMRAAVELLEPFDRAMRDLYASRSGQSAAQIEEWMDRETFFSGAQAVELGLADALLSSDEVTTDESVEARQRSAIQRVEASLAAQGISRKERRSLLAEMKAGMPSAAGTVTPSADEDLARAIRACIETLKP